MNDTEFASIYLRRDADGRISALSRVEVPGFVEANEADAAEVSDFLERINPAKSPFAESDLALIRVVEDLIDVLINKEILRLTDFPDSVQVKLFERRKLRHSLRSLNLLDDGHGSI